MFKSDRSSAVWCSCRVEVGRGRHKGVSAAGWRWAGPGIKVYQLQGGGRQGQA